MDPSLAISTAVTEAGHAGPGEPSGNSAQSRTVRYGLGRVSEGLLLLEIRGWAAAGYGMAARSKPNNQVRIFITRHSAPGEAGNASFIRYTAANHRCVTFRGSGVRRFEAWDREVDWARR